MDFSILIPTIEIGPPYKGPMAGLRRYSYSLVQSLANQDVDLHIITTSALPSDDQLLERENVKFYNLPPQISARGMYSTQTHFYAKNHRHFSKQAYEVFKQLNKKIDFSLIHSTEVSAYAFAKAKSKKEFTIPLIISLHGAVTTGNLKSRLFVKRPYSKLLRRVARDCDKIVSPSNSLLKKVKRLDKIAEGKVEIIPQSIDCKKFSQIPKLEDIEHFKDKYDLLQSQNIILIQGPFIPRKAQHEVVKYFPEIVKSNPDTIFLIVGEGPTLQKIKEEVINLKIDEEVRITGYVNNHELLLAYHASNILLYPAKEGSFGTPLIEAMACGLPIVAVDNTPMNEMLPPDCGWFYSPDNEREMVVKINEIVKNKEERQRITFSSKKHALEKYDYKIVGKKIIKFYKRTVKELQ